MVFIKFLLFLEKKSYNLNINIYNLSENGDYSSSMEDTGTYC